jgi:hypothetical protein
MGYENPLGRGFKGANPPYQILIIGMSRKSLNLLNPGADRVHLAVDTNLLFAVNDVSSQSPMSLVSDKQDRRLFFVYILDKMVFDSPSCAHPRASHNYTGTSN